MSTRNTDNDAILIVSGPSGVGKTTICKLLAQRIDAFLSVSMTTRARREGEVDGQDYHFVPREHFEELIANDGLLEYAKVYGGQFYGTPKAPVLAALEQGRPVILEIEIEGTLQVLRTFPDAITIYMLAPSPDDQQHRLVGRKQDPAEAIAERLSKADGEIRYAQECGAYKHFVINRDVDETVENLKQLVQEKQTS